VKHGNFITLEGGEGAGKTTQQSLIAKALRARGMEVLTTREPGGSPGAEDIRRLVVEGEVERKGGCRVVEQNSRRAGFSTKSRRNPYLQTGIL